MQNRLIEKDPLIKARQIPGARDNYFEIDVPGDGNCLFYSMVMTLLLPRLRDKRVFTQTFAILFPEQANLATSIWHALRWYDGSPDFFEQGDGAVLANLINFTFRPRLVQFMSANQMIDQDFLLEGDSIEAYCHRMSMSGTFGGEPELLAVAALYQTHVRVFNLAGHHLENLQEVRNQYGAEHQNEIQLMHVSYNYEDKPKKLRNLEKNHYRFLLKQEFLNQIIENQMIEQQEEPSEPRSNHAAYRQYQRELQKLRTAVNKLSDKKERNIGTALYQTLAAQQGKIFGQEREKAIDAYIYSQHAIRYAQKRFAHSHSRSFSNLLANLILFVGTLGVGYLLLGSIHFAFTDRFTFFNKPALNQELATVSQGLQTQAAARDLDPQPLENDYLEWSKIRF